MIRIAKSAEPPAVLATRGANKVAEMCAAFEGSEAEYRSGGRRFTFDRAVYGAPEVKEALKSAQHRKCAFCESLVDHVYPGDVEHYRPKAAVCREEDGALERPGYYWLAYDWDNLLFSCALCNQRHKANRFPLADATVRARCHRDALDDESPLFIHPAKEDPEPLIGFRAEVPFPVDGDPRARITIEALGLDREALNEIRRRRLEAMTMVAMVLDSPDVPEDLKEEARALLVGYVAQAAEYSSMARCFFRERGLL